MKAFFRPELAELAFVVFLLGTFLASVVFVRRGPVAPSAVTAVQERPPQLSSIVSVPPRKARAKRKVEPRFEAPRHEEVRAQPMDQGWLK